MNDQSIKDRLKNLGRKEGKNFDELLMRYTIERFLYRLSVSPHREHFVLKGGALLYISMPQSIFLLPRSYRSSQYPFFQYIIPVLNKHLFTIDGIRQLGDKNNPRMSRNQAHTRIVDYSSASSCPFLNTLPMVPNWKVAVSLTVKRP